MESIRDIMSEALTNTMKQYETPPESAPVEDTPPAVPAAEPEPASKEAEPKGQPAEPEKGQPETVSAEELGKLVEEMGPEALDAVDKTRLESELQEKIKLIDAAATKKYQAIAEKSKQLDDLLSQAQKSVEIANKQREKYKEVLGEEPEDDPKLAAMMQENAQKTWQLNVQSAVDKAKEVFPDFGMYGVPDTLAVIETTPVLQELLAAENGKYAELALEAAHFILQRKPENWSKIIASELEANEEAYKPQIDAIIKKRLSEAQTKNEVKKKGITQVKTEKKVEPTKPAEVGKGRQSVGGLFANEFMEFVNNPDKLEQLKRK